MSHSSDFRAHSVQAKRRKARVEKYYNFRHVKPGQLNSPHYCIIASPGKIWYNEPISEDTPIKIWNKQRLYLEAQQWPRPPKVRHAHKDKLDKRGVTGAYETRRYWGRQMERTLQSAVRLEEWTEADEGRRHYQDARGCCLCEFDVRIEDESEDNYKAKAKEDRWDVEEKLLQQWEMAAGTLIEHTDTARRVDILQLQEDGWSLCEPEEICSSVDEWEIELV